MTDKPTPATFVHSEAFVVPLEDPSDPSADEWARLDAANADTDARGRLIAVLTNADCDCDRQCTETRTHREHLADALVAAGLIGGLTLTDEYEHRDPKSSEPGSVFGDGWSSNNKEAALYLRDHHGYEVRRRKVTAWETPS